MSHNNQSRNESTQYRKPGRSGSFNQSRQFPGGASSKSGGGGGASNPSISTNRSFNNKKYNSNSQGGQPRPRSPNVSSDVSNQPAPPPAAQNGGHQQLPARRVSDAPATSTQVPVKPTGAQDQKVPGAYAKAVSSNVPTGAQPSNDSSGSTVPTTPAKAPGDASKSFTLQFGSISPGVMNGVQIPARTSSAPPNLDEQKKAQARHESLKAAPMGPGPSLPKQQLPKKDAGGTDQTNARELQGPPKSKRENQVSAVPHMTPPQKPAVNPIPGMHMQLPPYPMQVPVPFGGPNPQIQSHAMAGTSMPMPMPMPLNIGNPSAQQAMFVQGLQPHPMQSQGMMHQGHGLSFSSQMSPQINPQMNMGMSMAPQFSQQQPAKFNVPAPHRKSVKITDPKTHEELRLDSSPGLRSHINVTPQSQPVPSFPHPMGFYSNIYPPASSVPLSSSQVQPASQPPRHYNQVTVKPAVGSHGDKESLTSKGSIPIGKTEPLKLSKVQDEDAVHSQKETEPSSVGSLPQSKPVLGATPGHGVLAASPAEVKNDVRSGLHSTSAPVDYSADKPKDPAIVAKSGIVVVDAATDEHKRLSTRGYQEKVEGKSTPPSSMPSPSLVNEGAEPKSTSPKNFLVSGTANVSSSATVHVASDLTSGANASKSVPSQSTSVSRSNLDTGGRKEEPESSESLKPDRDSVVTSLRSLSPESPEVFDKKSEGGSGSEVTSSTASGLLENMSQNMEDSSSHCAVNVRMDDKLDSSLKMSRGDTKESSVPNSCSTAQSDKTSSASVSDGIESRDTQLSVEDHQEPASITVSSTGEGENGAGDNLALPPSVKEKILPDTSLAKATMPRGKKKKKDLYKKAEAAGTSSDLYNAYKGPEEKKESVTSAEVAENTSVTSVKQKSANVSQENAVSSEKLTLSKVEPDDWEDAAEISTPQLETSKNENQVVDGDGNGLMIKRYSRDFLLKFGEQCPDLPDGFEITSDIADVLMFSSANVSRDSYPSPGRNNERPSSRSDRRGVGTTEEDKWNKFPGTPIPGRGDMRADYGYTANVLGLRPGQGGNYGVLRSPRPQAPVQYGSGILSGPMQSLGPQGGLQRNNSESDRWQRGTAFQKGLMPSPQGSGPVIHRAERKYEVGKVTDEEQAKQRQLKGILNKLTPQNFEKLFEQVKQVNIDNVVTLSGVISQIFDKALMEPTFCEMYADFCFHLSAGLPDLSVDNEKITFKRLLLNKCQEEFERGEREEEEAKKAELEGENKQTAEDREEKRLQARRRMLGNIRLIGELYKKRMLTERIMHECIKKLLGQHENPDEENIEALCKLMSTIGEVIDHPRAKEYMDFYFGIMGQLSNNMKLSSRVRFMLKDSIDLRRNKWQQRRKVEGPKKIEDVHRDAAQERHAQSTRLARTPSFGNSVRRAPPMEFAPRAPNMLSPPPQMGGYRAVSPHMRGYGTQDARAEERHSFENRAMSIPLTQRPLGDDSITLGPQGGLARGMAFRGQTSAPSIPLGDTSNSGDARRMGPGLNGYNAVPERTSYGQREDLGPRYGPDRFGPQYDQSHQQEQYGNRLARNTDQSFDRSLPTQAPARPVPQANVPHASSENLLSEDALRDKSMSTIKEFYSIRDENEVAMCIKDLNSPSFHPSMISIWVADSFERKDIERDLLTKLIINLAKPRDGMITKDQLIKGFESVLTVLEDAENDAPRASEFLGRIFAKVIMDEVISLSKIGQLIYEGGEEQGRLVEVGLAAKVLGSLLDMIKLEKGDSVLNEIRSSNLRLENFRPPGSNKQLILDKYI